MNVYHRNLDSRIGRPIAPVSLATSGSQYLLLVHPDDTRMEVLRSRINQYRRDPRCKFVLFIKGSRFAGLGNAERAGELEHELANEVHFLRYALGDGPKSPEVLQRLHSFLDHAERNDTVDWRLLYPEKLPCLHALWARLSALRLLPPAAVAQWRESLVQELHLWRQAEAEYRSYTTRGFRLSLNTLGDDTLEAWMDEIRDCVLELSRHAI